jgi:hypothetical protein
MSSSRRKSAIEHALEYSQKTTNYIFEDTNERCYRDFHELFELSGWKKIPFKRKPKLAEKKK